MTRKWSRATVLSIMTSLVTLSGASAGRPEAQRDPAPVLTEAEIFLELNDTDGDLGLHGSIDGGPWVSISVEGPDDRLLLEIISRGRLRNQGMTQLFFESAEPSFDELDPEKFFGRFPEGEYEIEARGWNGLRFEGSAELSHVLADRPRNVTLNFQAAAESCDSDPLPEVQAPVLIRWDPVTTSHPELGREGPVEIERYQLFVERGGINLSLDLPPTVTEFEVPIGVTEFGTEFKFEIIARTTDGNNTAIESCFLLK